MTAGKDRPYFFLHHSRGAMPPKPVTPYGLSGWRVESKRVTAKQDAAVRRFMRVANPAGGFLNQNEENANVRSKPERSPGRL